VNAGVAIVVPAGEIVRRRFPAQVAIDALVVDTERPGSVGVDLFPGSAMKQMRSIGAGRHPGASPREKYFAQRKTLGRRGAVCHDRRPGGIPGRRGTDTL